MNMSGTVGMQMIGGENKCGLTRLRRKRLAELFHHYQNALMPEASGKGSERGGGEWKQVPQQEKNRLVSAVRLALLELESVAHEQAKPRQYFAQPGEAEWGC
jgi:hypothetical protein